MPYLLLLRARAALRQGWKRTWRLSNASRVTRSSFIGLAHEEVCLCVFVFSIIMGSGAQGAQGFRTQGFRGSGVQRFRRSSAQGESTLLFPPPSRGLAMKIPQRFCFCFCRKLSMPWNALNLMTALGQLGFLITHPQPRMLQNLACRDSLPVIVGKSPCQQI